MAEDEFCCNVLHGRGGRYACVSDPSTDLPRPLMILGMHFHDRSSEKVKFLRNIGYFLLAAGIFLAIGFSVNWIYRRAGENRVLKAVVERLSAETRVAEVLVTQSRFDEASKRIETTIKFLEYDAAGKPLLPRYFTFQGNVIQFQSLVIRFSDRLVKAGHRLKGKSAYLFLKVFILDGSNTQVYDLAKVNEIPRGYKVPGLTNEFEEKLWREFWTYALDPKARERSDVKNAQIEAPGSLFLPGTIYT
ncbi:MAG: hypothetical protein HY610_02305, partial [Elusimicrobia bacterium]|nr:hypothetical protein [Elusimicrobiota bacterium]